MLAGLRQIFSPAFTAETIFRIKDPDARNVVMELGFCNVSMAPLALLSLYRTNGTPAAIVGAVFYGLAGLQHLRNTERTRLTNIALASDLFIATIADFYLIAA
jgi:GTP:adenosylcobinamide-phosphate guanylyltransferase